MVMMHVGDWTGYKSALFSRGFRLHSCGVLAGDYENGLRRSNGVCAGVGLRTTSRAIWPENSFRSLKCRLLLGLEYLLVMVISIVQS